MSTDTVQIKGSQTPTVRVVNAQPETVEIVSKGQQGPPGTTQWSGLQNIPSWIIGISAWATGLLNLGSFSSLKSSLSLTKSDVGLGNVDNTADSSKPVSSPQATAIATAQATAISTAEGYTDTQVASAISTAEGYADNAKAQAISTAEGYTDTAKSYILGLLSSITSSVGSLVTGVSSVAGKTGAVTLAKADVGLDQVDNTSDVNKPVSSAQQTAIASAQATAITTSEAYTDTQIATVVPLSQKGLANGVASLDGGGKVPVAQLPASLMQYLGTWNASTNTPTLTNGSGVAGTVYNVTVAGNALGENWMVGDWAIYNGSVWERSPNADDIVSVNGKTGSIVLKTDDISEGTSNLYFTVSRVLGSILTGLSTASSAVITATDSVLTALGKLQAQISTLAPINSPTLTGTPTAPTAGSADSSTTIATTAYVKSQLSTSISQFTSSVRSTSLSGLNTATSAVITASNSVIGAFGLLQAQINTITAAGYQTAAQVLSAITWTNLSGKPSSFTPSSHASTHASGGSDPITIAASQVTGTIPIGSLPATGQPGQALIMNSTGTALTFGSVSSNQFDASFYNSF
jgi:hypothetical protein